MDEFTFTSFDHLESKLEKCDDCCNGDYMSFHCPLCPVSKYKPRKKAKLQQHLAVHWNTRIQGKNDLPFDDTDELPDIVDNPPEDKDEEYKPKSREDKERAKIKYIKERNQQKRNNLEQFREGLNPHQLHRLHETASDIYNYFNNIITDNKLKPANEGLFWSNRLHKEDEEITVVATTIGDTTISYVDSIILSDANTTINESDMEELFALIFHEFVHAYLFVHGLSDYSDHGPVWNRKMKQLMRLVKTNRHLRPARIKDVNIEENRVRTHAGRKR